MRTARVAGLLALVASLAGPLPPSPVAPGVARAQVAPPAGVWVVTTDRHHASCLPQALPEAPMAIRTDGKVGTVIVQVGGAWGCRHAVDRLLAFGVESVEIDGVRHALHEVRCDDSRAPASVRWALSLAEFQLAEQRLWERLQAGLDADAAGSLDVKAAKALAARCPRMIAEVLAPVGIDTSAISTYRRLRFTHDGWTGTLDDLRREKCAQVAAAAERVRRRASTHVRLDETRQQLFATSPDGWYVPGARTRTLDPAVLLRARVWIQVEDVTLEDLVDGACPASAPAVTRYTRYTFDARGVLVRRASTVTCAPFSPSMLK